MAILSLNPATEEIIAEFDAATPAQIESVLETAMTAFDSWRHTSLSQRAELMLRAAKQLRDDRDRLAALVTAEMGKPIAESEAEVEKCAWNCEFYAEHAAEFLADQPKASSATESFIAFDPLGPVLAVMPWNFPFWQVFRFAAPALMAGNTAVLKHASNVPQCALAIEEVFQTAGFPTGVFRTLLIPGSAVAEVIADPRIRAVTLTGSEDAGVAVAVASGRALKKTVLELGGSDPFIVLEDADLETATEAGARARNMNSGQSCISAKRFIVVESVAEEFEARFVKAVGALRVGDPTLRATQVGPLARDDLRAELHDQVARSVALGARVVLGGRPREGTGYFYEPTVLAGVSPEMAVSCEETFGPVAAVLTVRDSDEAIAVANHSDFGLGAALWTADVDRGRRLARNIEAGAVFINGLVASDPRLPFGGIKRSGYGRELGEFGIREFVNVKTVWVGPARSS